MTTEKDDRINIPLNFKIACTLYNLPVHKVLQFFIDHVSFYDSMSTGFNGAYSNATNTMISCPGKTKTSNTGLLPHREMIIKYIREIIAVTMQHGTTEAKKRQKSIPIINRLYKSLPVEKKVPKVLYLNKKSTLALTIDFCVFCEIHDCGPKIYLEHFMNKISLADISARIGLQLIVENQAMAFFSKLIKGYGNLNSGIPADARLQSAFFNDVQEMRLKMDAVKDLEKQRKAFQKLYYAYYKKLLQQSESH